MHLVDFLGQASNGALVMAHHIEVPLVTIFFQIFFQEYFFQKNFKKKVSKFFLQIFFRFFLNLGSLCLISVQIALCGQTSRKVTHPHTTPAQTRLTS